MGHLVESSLLIVCERVRYSVFTIEIRAIHKSMIVFAVHESYLY